MRVRSGAAIVGPGLVLHLVPALLAASPASAAGGGGSGGALGTLRSNVCCPTGPENSLGAEGPANIVKDYAAELWRARPTLAAAMGVYEHNRELESFSPAALRARQRSLEGTLGRLAWFVGGRAPRMSLRDIDLLFLRGRVRAELAELRQDRIHERDPGLYVRLAGSTVDGLLRRSFAPLCERLRDAAARAEQVPRLLAEARQNLRDPPELWIDMAIADADEVVRFYEQDVPQAAVPCAEAEVQAVLLQNVLLHETYPGHYVQGLYLQGDRPKKRSLRHGQRSSRSPGQAQGPIDDFPSRDGTGGGVRRLGQLVPVRRRHTHEDHRPFRIGLVKDAVWNERV